MDEAERRENEERDSEPTASAASQLLCLNLVMKATPAEEAGARYIYIQASDESVDAQGEKVLCKALQESASTFLNYGSLDIDHIVLKGPASGLQNYMEYEIGKPVDVGFESGKTFVKAQLYTGDTPLSRNANMVWDSMTRLNPPARWYPSIGGKGVRGHETDPVTKSRVPVIKSVYWVNLALSRTPVNQAVPVAQTVPMGVFAKSLGAYVLKSDAPDSGLSAGYGTDSAKLTNGAALRNQSLDKKLQSYWTFSSRVASDLKKGACGSSVAAIADHASRNYGLSESKAAAWSRRFVDDLCEAIKERD